MSRKHFIELANAIREHNRIALRTGGDVFTPDQIDTLATFSSQQNRKFNRSRWIDYIAGKCGPMGGALKRAA